jgi:glycosidase
VIFLPTTVEGVAPTKLSEADLTPRGKVHPSPIAWRDQIIYFLLPDRFSDARENERPLFDLSKPEQYKAEKRRWMEDGKAFRGGTINGIASKLDYLKGLGVTALWIAPVYKQRLDMETYHGYAIQNFLDVDPHFGSRQDLRDLVDAAHKKGIYIILDVIYNHSGNNWFYLDQNEEVNYKDTMDYRFEPPYPFGKWRSEKGDPIGNVNSKEDGIWPEDFQEPEYYTRAGHIERWDPDLSWEDPKNDDCEFRRGDFWDLKDLNHKYNNNQVLSKLIRVYEYWIALSDCDGFRIDTVKHTTIEGTRNFCGAIREFAESIGKNNFLLVGEVAGGANMVYEYVDKTVSSYLNMFYRNIDAALDIGEAENRLANLILGTGRPKEDFFDQFGGVDALGSHRLTGQFHVSMLDEHDMIGRGKCRFYARSNAQDRYQQVAHAVGVQLTTLGIPCIYYGTEQAFDGCADQHNTGIEPIDDEGRIPYEDRYVRECMFGKGFGSYQTTGCHFFNKNHPTYIRIAAIARVRNRKDPIGLALRRGRQYMRQIAVDDDGKFILPQPGQLVAWSRILHTYDVLVVLNTNAEMRRSARILLDSRFHAKGSAMSFLYRGDWSDAELRGQAPLQTVEVEYLDTAATVFVDLPPAGMAILSE